VVVPEPVCPKRRWCGETAGSAAAGTC
jgi:hypothetical protein